MYLVVIDLRKIAYMCMKLLRRYQSISLQTEQRYGADRTSFPKANWQGF